MLMILKSEILCLALEYTNKDQPLAKSMLPTFKTLGTSFIQLKV